MKRVVHYINQFFGGIGGEEKAQTTVLVREGPIGPGRLLQQSIEGQGEVVATIICGDDYVAENEDEAGRSIDEALESIKPDLMIAGPAFNSGRHGLGCALACRLAQARGIPAVTGMHPENAAVLTHRRRLLAVATGTDATEMQAILSKMAALGMRLARGEELGPVVEEGYLPTGVRRLVFKEKVGYERALDMLMARVENRPFMSEVQIQSYETVPPAKPIEDLSKSKIGVVVSTGIVPKGNPDRQLSAWATEVYRYSIEGVDALTVDDWESVHGGFNTRTLNTVNPNYALPLRSLRELEAQGAIGEIYPYFFSTVGNGCAVGPAQEIGRHVAEEFAAAGVDAALEVSG